jgi:hypothetical protein
MKLNFWQVLGAVIFVLALVFIIRRETAQHGGPQRPPNPAPEFSPQQAVEGPTTNSAAATQPAAAP